MKHHRFFRRIGRALLPASFALIASWVMWFGSAKPPEFNPSVRSTFRKPAGSPRLVSIEKLPDLGTDGEMCAWVPASASPVSLAAFRQELREIRLAALQERREASSAASGSALDAQRQEIWKRPPVRMIRDPYAAYSAVAVDVANNEVVMTDENLFQVLVYDRMANTPPTASMTEPKRMLGGLETKIEFQCGLYIDPANGDIFAVNNDTVDTLVIFSREARGNVPPTRELYTPHGTYGIAVDEGREEMYLTIQHDSALVVFPKYATQDVPPLRLIQGDKTRLADPHGVAVDTKNNLLFVTNHGSTHTVSPEENVGATGIQLGRREGKPNWPIGLDQAIPGSGRNVPPSITVYARTASGDAAPLRVIEGPKTQMNWPTGIAVDPDRNEIYIANDGGDSILVFDASASGDAAPIRVIKGPKSMVSNPTGVFLDKKNNELWVANFGNHTAAVYRPTANGDTPPLRVIRSAPPDRPTPGMGNPHPLAYDSKREEILVPN